MSAEEQQNLQQSILTTENQDSPPDSQPQPPKTTMNAAMFAMMAAAMGTGIFNLPLRITQIGLFTFIAYVVIASLFSLMGAEMLREMVVRNGYESYSEASMAAYGNVLKRLSQFCLILYPWGIAVCYQVILVKFLLQLMADVLKMDLYANRQQQIYNHHGNLVRILANVIVICTNFVLISQKNINIIQRFAIISVSAVAFNTLTIFILFLTGFHHSRPNLDYHGFFHVVWSKVRWFIADTPDSLSQHAQALASILFCYVNHQLIFPSCRTLEDPTPSRLKTLFLRAHVGELSSYILIGISAYLLLVEHEDVEPIGPMVLTSFTVWPMTLGKLMMVLALYFSIPLNIFPARTILFEAVGCEKSNKNHYILSVALAVSSCIIAISFVKVNSYFGLLGGTAGVLMCGTIPGLCYYKLIVPEAKPEQQMLNKLKLAFCGLITVVGFTGAILSVLDPA